MIADEFQKAVTRLKEALEQPKTEFVRDSVIQRFEFCVELAWKSSRRKMGSSTPGPKDVVREMAQGKYILDVEIWLKAIDMRNLSYHTCRESVAEQVYLFAQSFLIELQGLVGRLK